MINYTFRWLDGFAGALLLLCLGLLLWQGAPVNQIEIPQNVFLPMHALLEIISVVVAALIFLTAFGTQESGRSLRVVLLGCFFLATALFDTIHVLSYIGMPDMISMNSNDKMIWFWLAGRISAGLGLLAYTIRPHTHAVTVKVRFAMMAGTLAAVVLVAWVIIFHEWRLPALYIDGEGLTGLKIVAEWGVFWLYLLTAALIYRHRRDIVNFNARSLILGLLIMAAGELFFTVYVQVSSTANLLGHVYKVIGYSFLYHAIFAEVIRQPFLRIEQLMNEVGHERDFAKQLLDTAPAIILLRDPRGMIQHVNPYFEQLTGYRLDEIKARDWFSTFIPASEQSRIRALFHQSQHETSVRGNINSIITRSGDKCEIEWNDEALHDADGNVTGVLAIGVDVSERIRAMESLRYSERELKRLNESLEDRVAARTSELEQEIRRNKVIINTSIDGFFSADSSGQLSQVNPAFCTMLGYSEAELLQMTIPDIEASESPEEIDTHILKIMREGYDRFDTLHRCKDGSLIEVEVSVTVVALDNDEPILYAFTRDIGPRKNAECRLRQALEEAERANAAKSDFLSRMSHELRTPLNAILGFSQMLQMPGAEPLSEQQADNVHEIRYAGEHLLTMVNEVLNLARIESGRMDISLEPISVVPVIEACLAQIRPLAAQRRIKIAMEPSIFYTVQADSRRLKEVLLNLLSNAVKYNRVGGTIKVDCTLTQAERLRISIHDSGYGIADKDLPRLFLPFERLESSYEGVEGTGIGLALSRRLVEGMQGEIGVDSTPGEGSTFWFELPLSAECDASASHYKVLYIEDNPANLRLVQSILDSRQDIELLTADSVEAGLEMATRQRPDLILLDLNLPGMNGFEALRRLSANPRTYGIPVIAVTANAMVTDIERGKLAGFSEYISKPINVPGLLKTIDRHLTIRKDAL